MSAFEQGMSRSTNIYIAPARLEFRVQGRRIPKLMKQKKDFSKRDSVVFCSLCAVCNADVGF